MATLTPNPQSKARSRSGGMAIDVWQKMKHLIITRMLSVVNGLIQRGRPAIVFGFVGSTFALAATAVVKIWGAQFLPLDFEGKITFGAAAIA
jgi:hypothetical protein